MISEGSWDTEDCSYDAQNAAVPSQIYELYFQI